jgi:hypothetical protein
MRRMIFPILSTVAIFVLGARLCADTWRDVWVGLSLALLVVIICVLMTLMWAQVLGQIKNESD